MNRVFYFWIMMLAAESTVPAAESVDLLDSTFASYCVKCHGQDGEVNGNFDLRAHRSAASLVSKPKLLAKIVEAVRNGEMPPPGETELPSERRDPFVARLDALYAESLRNNAVAPRTPIRRMNRFQYANAVVDLLDLKVEPYVLPERILRDISGYFHPETGTMPERVEVGNRLLGKSQLIARRLSGVVPFPQDPKAGNGFDNRADLLTVSPLLMESFLELSRSIFESPDFKATTCGKWKKYFLPPPKSASTEKACADALRDLLTRAFRRPVDEKTLQRYVAYAAERMKGGDDFTVAMKATASAALASPQFLYLCEGATTGSLPQQLDDYELASRLSFFLWSSGPDDELLSVAASGTLADPAVLAVQADRLLNDARMKRFCDAFASQWLKIEYLASFEPDKKLFPDFYRFGIAAANRGSVHMMLEPLLVFETVFIENRPLADLIQSDFTYRSEQLRQFLNREKTYARFKPGPNYTEVCVFDRIPVTTKREGGVVTTSAVMALTSGPNETKPITRGKWIIETLFNDPPPPPPANVPDLTEAEADGKGSKKLSLREKFALHRTRSDCNSCHAKIDPFGFALENYDAVGRWRDTDVNGQAIDASGRLFNRLPFTTIEEFKDALLEEKKRFARGFTGHLMKYALGRELEPADQPSLDQIIAAAATDDFRLRNLMKHVVLSEPFRKKFNPAAERSDARNNATTN